MNQIFGNYVQKCLRVTYFLQAVLQFLEFLSFGIQQTKSFQIIITFALVTFAWIFFRSDSINFAFAYIHKILSFSLFTFPKIFPKTVLGYIFLFLIIEWYGRNESFAIEKFGTNWKKIYRIIFYYALTILILYFYGKDYQFLYFQF